MIRPVSPRTIKRLVRRLEAADAVCAELRTQLSARVVDADWSRLPDLLAKWIGVTPAHIRYSSSTPKQKEQVRCAQCGDEIIYQPVKLFDECFNHPPNKSVTVAAPAAGDA